MRPRFSDAEIKFLLDLCENERARFKRQLQNLTEQHEHFVSQEPALKRMFDVAPYPNFQKLKECRDKKQSLADWLPAYDRMNVFLTGLVIRFGKMLTHKTGRVPFLSLEMIRYNDMLRKEGLTNLPMIPETAYFPLMEIKQQ